MRDGGRLCQELLAQKWHDFRRLLVFLAESCICRKGSQAIRGEGTRLPSFMREVTLPECLRYIWKRRGRFLVLTSALSASVAVILYILAQQIFQYTCMLSKALMTCSFAMDFPLRQSTPEWGLIGVNGQYWGSRPDSTNTTSEMSWKFRGSSGRVLWLSASCLAMRELKSCCH